MLIFHLLYKVLATQCSTCKLILLLYSEVLIRGNHSKGMYAVRGTVSRLLMQHIPRKVRSIKGGRAKKRPKRDSCLTKEVFCQKRDYFKFHSRQPNS